MFFCNILIVARVSVSVVDVVVVVVEACASSHLNRNTADGSKAGKGAGCSARGYRPAVTCTCRRRPFRFPRLSNARTHVVWRTTHLLFLRALIHFSARLFGWHETSHPRSARQRVWACGGWGCLARYSAVTLAGFDRR